MYAVAIMGVVIVCKSTITMKSQYAPLKV